MSTIEHPSQSVLQNPNQILEQDRLFDVSPYNLSEMAEEDARTQETVSFDHAGAAERLATAASHRNRTDQSHIEANTIDEIDESAKERMAAAAFKRQLIDNKNTKEADQFPNRKILTYKPNAEGMADTAAEYTDKGESADLAQLSNEDGKCVMLTTLEDDDFRY